ncbi:MAG: adenine phosphoribosyltransferase [Verrucomicrobia bacterium]|nr:adenine phosphoribosyltransferase [Verrucomicrobiota bacterium]
MNNAAAVSIADAPPDLAPLYAAVRDVPDFPKPGILFKDIMPLLADADCLRLAIDAFAARCRAIEAGLPEGGKIDKIVGIDARGFLFGAAVAYALGVGFIPVRKKGKLPGKTEMLAYALEYGEAVVEMHTDALRPGDKVVLIDDLLATGGTAAAALRLIEKLGGQPLAALFLIELDFLAGRTRLAPVVTEALLKY